MKFQITSVLFLLVVLLLPTTGCAKNKKKMPDVNLLLEEGFISFEMYIEDIERAKEVDDYVKAFEDYGIRQSKVGPKMSAQLIKFTGYKNQMDQTEELKKALADAKMAWQKKWINRIRGIQIKLEKVKEFPRVIEAVNKLQEVLQVVDLYNIPANL